MFTSLVSAGGRETSGGAVLAEFCVSGYQLVLSEWVAGEPQDKRFHAAVEVDDQPASSYKMPIGGVSADILADIDNKVLSTLSRMHSRKVSKLLQYPGVHSRKFYRFKGEEFTKAKALSSHVTELAG